MKKFLLIGLAFSAVLFLAGCPTNNDDGGQGADFDSSLYYTKAEINGLFADVYEKGEVNDLLPIYGGEMADLNTTHSSYTSGGFITVPAGYNFLILRARAQDDTNATDIKVCIGISDVDYAEWTYPKATTALQLMFFDMSNYTSDAKIWLKDCTVNVSTATCLWLR